MSDANTRSAAFAGGGEMGRRMRELDWVRTPLGPVEKWPQSLKTAVRIMLTSRQPMFVWWGPTLINLYNDAYRAMLGTKHPDALGQPAADVWQEVWGSTGTRVETAMQTNIGTYDEAFQFLVKRRNDLEEVYITFSYSPVPDDDDQAGGILCACTEETKRVIGARQQTMLSELAAHTVEARTFEDACRLSAEGLATNLIDLPFALIYLVEPDAQHATLAATSGIDRGHVAAPTLMPLDTNALWPVAEAHATLSAQVVADLDTRFDKLPTGAWSRPPHQAVVLPIMPTDPTRQVGILIAGLNPFRRFDDSYAGFLNLVAAQIATSLANARAYEAERQRAEALAELDREKTAFFNTISHVFRAPLMLVLNQAQAALDDPATPANERERITEIRSNALRLQTLVNLLLDFSRTAAQQAEQELRLREERYRALVHATATTVWRMNANGEGLIEIEGDLLEPHGVKAGSTDIRLLNYVHPDEQEFTLALWRQAIETGTIYDHTHRTLAPDGTEHYVHSRGVPLRDESGNIREWVGTITDITEHMQAQAQLEANRHLFQRIAETSPNLLAVYDFTTERTSYINTRSEQVIGYSADEVIALGSSFASQYWHPDDLRTLNEQVQVLRNLTDDDIYENEFRVRQTDGAYRWLRARTSVFMRDDRGKVRQIITVTQDVSERKRTQEALQRARAELEQRVAERTSQLTTVNAELRSEIAERKRTEAARQQLLALLVTAQEEERSHLSRELHDQLGQQLAALKLALNSSIEPPAHSSIDPSTYAQINAIVEQLGRDMRTLAWELRPPALDDLGLREALVTYIGWWQQGGAVEVDFQAIEIDSLPLAPAIEITLYRVVQETLTNVRKHALARTVSIILKLKRNHPSYIHLIVEDDGNGFDVESTLRGATLQRRLGLHGMRERVALVGGTLDIESAPQTGTTIFVRIPISYPSASPVEDEGDG